MHEFGIVQAIEEQVRRLLRKHKAARPTRIVVRASPRDGLSREALDFAFGHMLEDAGWLGAELELRIETDTVACPGCGRSFADTGARERCPHCGETVVIRAAGPVLMSVEME